MRTKELLAYLQGILFTYQWEILHCDSRRMVAVKARRIGLSFIMALKVLLHGLKYPHEIAFVGSKLDNSKIYLRYIRENWIPVLNAFGAGIQIEKDNETTVKIKGGPTFLACSTNVDALRGGTYSVYWDESAYLPVREQKRILDALLPMSESEYTPYTRLWIVSTPAGTAGTFYEIVSDQETYSDFERFEITIWDAIKQGFEFDKKRLQRMNPSRRAREYECSFLALEDAFWQRILLEDLDVGPQGESKNTKHLVLGIDLGKKNDLTSVVVRDRNHFAATYLIEGLDYVDQVPVLSSLIKRYDPRKVFVDATRTETVSEMLRAEHGSRVRGIHGTQQWKVRTIEDLDRCLSKDEISFDFGTSFVWNPSTKMWVPESRKPLLMDLLLLRQVQTRAGSLTYQLARDESGHGDSAAAAILAHAAAMASTSSPKVTPGAASRARTQNRIML